MINYTYTNIEKVSVHSVGNKTNGEELHLSKSLLNIEEERVKELLFKFFLTPFEDPEFYTFTFSNDDFTLNPVFNFAFQIFDDKNNFHPASVDIAKYLYDLSVHPQIKSGDLFIAYFTDVCIQDELADAIGIFKSENLHSFLKLDNSRADFSIHCDDGINTDKLDKGCLIFNTERHLGSKVCIIDKSNKSSEAQYWRDSFLQLKPSNDDYHRTKEFMNITKNYVTKQLSSEFEVSRADQIDYLNRTVDYFKTNETFDQRDFEEKVFQDENIIRSFGNFNETYKNKHSIDLDENFDISTKAVKKQARVLKTVLKLDRNFHIYIHGDPDLIEQGVEKDGRKYYKIYFEKEE